jgi:hypothetical protein
MSSPPHPFFFSFFLSRVSLVRPRRRVSLAPTAYCRRPARAGCVKAGRFSAATVRLGLYTTEHDGRLDGSGRLHSYLIFSSSTCRRGVIVFRSRMLFLAGLATRSMARAIVASTYIRQLRSGLPRCCLHGRSRRWMGLIFGTAYWQVPICDVGQQPRIRPARHTRLGCRNSARYRVRAAPCGTRPCSR